MLPVWTFQRGHEQLVLYSRESRRGVVLVVSGDGDPRSYTFHDFNALVKFEGEMEEFLIETGWSPARLTVQQEPTLDGAPPRGGASRQRPLNR
jgi:hypothetical protein